MVARLSVRCQVAAIAHCSCLGLEERADGQVPLLLPASPPLSEEIWQFSQAPKAGCRAYFDTVGEVFKRQEQQSEKCGFCTAELPPANPVSVPH